MLPGWRPTGRRTDGHAGPQRADDVGIERYAPFAAELVEAACPARGSRLAADQIADPLQAMQRWPVAVTTATSSARDSGFTLHPRSLSR